MLRGKQRHGVLIIGAIAYMIIQQYIRINVMKEFFKRNSIL